MVINRLVCAVALSLWLSSVGLGQSAQDVVEATGVHAGLVVHVGTTDGRLEADLAASGSMLVHGLTHDAARLKASRSAIRAAGRYGMASLQLVRSYDRLPYANDLVNLLVADLDALGDRAPKMDEIRRVVAPTGVAWLKQGGQWKKHVEPLPSDVDEWRHWDHGADGNPSSSDKRVAPTHSLRWLAGTTSVDGAGSKVGLRVADGRVYYTAINYDAESRFNRQRRNDLFARDAFNGLLSWKRTIDGVPGGGDTPPRFALTASDGRVYCYPKEGGYLQALDAQTGKTLVRFEHGPKQPPLNDWNKWNDPVRKIHFVVRVFDGKVLQTYGNTAYLSDAATGELLWKTPIDGAVAIGWAVVGGGKVYVAAAERDLVKNRASHATPADRIVALDAATGKPVWQYTALKGRMLFRMIYHRDSVVTATFGMKGYKPNFGKEPLVVRFDAKDGSKVWEASPRADARGHYSIVMAQGDEVIVGQQSGFGLDFKTGKFTRKYGWGQADASCADLKGVPGYTLYGLAFINDKGDHITRGQTRTICDVGLFPAYGMLYGSPLGCLCSEYINGYLAMSPTPHDEPVSDDQRLVKGPAFGTVKGVKAGASRVDDWPMHLADARRSASSRTAVKGDLKVSWRRVLATWPTGPIAQDWQDNEKIVGLLSAPTAAAGKLFVAAPDAHAVHAINPSSGEVAWSFTAWARIDSPPTVLHGEGDALCLFGSRDGWVYCLRASDGELVWQFLAGRNDTRITVQSQLESPWPVFGSVMVDGDGVVVSAGRQSATDGGISIYKLDPAEGRIVWQTRLWTDPDATRKLEDKDLYRARTRNRRVNDLLVHNGENVCLWVTPFKATYESDETVDIETAVISARALRHSVPSKDELRDINAATWIWSASSAGLLSRRQSGVGRHDAGGVNYAQLNAAKICLADGGKTLYAIEASANKSKTLRGGLIRVTLKADGTLPEQPDWVGKIAGGRVTDAFVVAGERLYIARSSSGADGSQLLVYSTRDGSHLGTHALPARPVRDGLIVAFGRLYAACTDGAVYQLSQ